MISTVIGFSRQKTQMRTTVRDQLSGVVQELNKVLFENQELQTTLPMQQDSRFFRRSASIQESLATLCRQATALIELAPEIVFDIEFSVLARATEVVGDFPEAERYWKEAVKSSPTDYYRIINTRGYGAFSLRQGEHERGRRLFEEALSIWGNTTDFNKFANGYTYQFWGSAEWWNSPGHGRADECFRNAKDIYETISGDAVKAQALRNLRSTHPEPVPTGPSGPTGPADGGLERVRPPSYPPGR